MKELKTRSPQAVDTKVSERKKGATRPGTTVSSKTQLLVLIDERGLTDKILNCLQKDFEPSETTVTILYVAPPYSLGLELPAYSMLKDLDRTNEIINSARESLRQAKFFDVQSISATLKSPEIELASVLAGNMFDAAIGHQAGNNLKKLLDKKNINFLKI